MKSGVKAAAAVFFGLFFLSCTSKPAVTINGKRFYVELAVTPQERALGLMFRQTLEQNHGMLFLFENEQILSFWMQNTSVPLSIAYIDQNGIIIDIFDMEPYDLTPVESTRPVMYALEVNRGEFSKQGVRPGNRVIFPKEVKEIRGNSGE